MSLETILENISSSKDMLDFLSRMESDLDLKDEIYELIKTQNEKFCKAIWTLIKDAGDICDFAGSFPTCKPQLWKMLLSKDVKYCEDIWALIKDAGDICILARTFLANKAQLSQIILSNPEKLKEMIKTLGDFVGLIHHFPKQKLDFKDFAIKQGIWNSLAKTPQNERVLVREFPSITSNPYLKADFSFENKPSHIEPSTIEIPHNSPTL